MRKRMFFTVLIFFNIILFAQVGSIFSNPSFAQPDFNFSSLLNPNVLKINHSASFMTGVNSSRNAFYQSVYTTHLDFNFHPKFTMLLDLNVVNLGSGDLNKNLSFSSHKDNSTFVVPHLTMSYKPTENTMIKFEIQHPVFSDNNLHYQQYDNWRW